MAPPFSSAGFRPPPGATGKFVAQAVRLRRSISKKTVKDYIEDTVVEGAQDLAASWRNKDDGHQLGSSAAASYGALTFDISVGEGTSPQSLPMGMDITSELVWAQCDPCASCGRQTPTFFSARSRSFQTINCNDQRCRSFFPGNTGDTCGINNDDEYCKFQVIFFGSTSTSNSTSGYFASETFNFGSTPFPDMVFGCRGQISDPELAVVAGASGIAGFNRGPLSLVSQLDISQFSYLIALPDGGSGKRESFLTWTWGGGGDDTAARAPAKGSRSTPLLVPRSNQNPYLYYVKLTGIKVDGQLLTAIPAGTFDVGADGSGGAFLSTTLPVTYLAEAAYNVLRKELVDGISVTPARTDDGPNHLCFHTEGFENAKVPKLALVFDGADASMELSVENYFSTLGDGNTCLTILPSIGGSVLGSLLQMDTAMTYDIYADGSGLLTFETAAAAAAAAQAQVPTMVVVATLLAAWGLSL